jgi:two-component system response regulator FixJ
MQPPRVVHVVDDDEGVRVSAAILLDGAGFDVEEYESGVAFLDALPTARPGCILLDIHMPEISGLRVQSRLNELGVKWPIIILTGQGDVNIAVQAMKAGAFEFLEKPYTNELVLATLRDAFDKLEAVQEDSARVLAARALIDRLSKREYEVLQGLLAGLQNKLIAYELDLSVRTVEIYRANVMEKLEARGLSTAVRIALTAGVQPMVEQKAPEDPQ